MAYQEIFGVISCGAHVDVSSSLHGAKCYATRNGHDVITLRPNCDYYAWPVAQKIDGKWVKVTRVQETA